MTTFAREMVGADVVLTADVLEEHERLVRDAVGKEREACAQLVDDERVRCGDRWGLAALHLRRAAAAIRARSRGA